MSTILESPPGRRVDQGKPPQIWENVPGQFFINAGPILTKRVEKETLSEKKHANARNTMARSAGAKNEFDQAACRGAHPGLCHTRSA
ncbi:MAG TPA: hypothetical protein VFG04_11210 [Planctomycetaceae bacterium]|jgi:hypothetical protein|nr:hypothetical protein [Planctomycetaceae bacterium]